jgi:hypothetical protein
MGLIDFRKMPSQRGFIVAEHISYSKRVIGYKARPNTEIVGSDLP